MLQHYLLATQAPPHTAQRNYAHKLFAHLRNRAEAVFHPRAVTLQLVVALQAVKLAVEQHPFAVARHILVWEVHFDVALQRAIIHKSVSPGLASGSLLLVQVGKLIIFQLCDSLVEYLLVRFVTQVGNESALLSAEQVARPAYVEVLHGYVDARA